MKAIILAAGLSTRLYPATMVISKQLLPVYDKPMIYYSLSTILLAGINNILIVCTPRDLPLYRLLLQDGSQWGISIKYAVQEEPKGIADAFIIAASFIGNDSIALILGDNIFYGNGLIELLESAVKIKNGAVIFAYFVQNPQRYGVVTLGKYNQPLTIEEKPQNPVSKWAVTGLYFYDKDVVDIASKLRPSQRGELEITDVNKAYLERGNLSVKLLGRGFAWMDAGTPDSLIETSEFIKNVEHRQGLKIGCVEEIAWKKGFIDDKQLLKLAAKFKPGAYKSYLEDLVNMS